MPRALRIEYHGAIYHVVNHGDYRASIFRDDLDRNSFRELLAEACSRTDWQVHAYCLMPNHFHLVVETPNANLSAGMQWLLGAYTAGHNQRHAVRCPVFGGRYRAVVVDGAVDGHLRTVCDYVHLNPARARLLPAHEMLRSFQWSSWPDHLRAAHQRPHWQRVDRLQRAYLIPEDNETGRRHLERCVELQRFAEDETRYKHIRRGWCLGGAEFRAQLLARMHARKATFVPAAPPPEATVEKARRLIAEELARLGWTTDDLTARAKSAPEKVWLAQRLQRETSVTLQWIAGELHMGARSHVANLLHRARQKERQSYAAILQPRMNTDGHG